MITTFDLRPQEPPTGTRLTAELRVLRRVGDYLRDHVPGYRDCHEQEKILACIWSAREALDTIESAVEEAHLSCCILPGVQAPLELARGLTRLRDLGRPATIVCEHRQGLEEYARRGIPLDVRLTPELLEYLFDPSSRGHQGAALVRRNRVIAAGVPLPLAAELTDSSGRILEERERAAIAFSRITDSVVFVVTAEPRILVGLDGLVQPVSF